MDLVQRKQAVEEGLHDFEVKDFSGLSLKIDQPNQPNNVWQVLDNVDLYVPGSIRKVLPPTLYSSPSYPVSGNIIAICNYYAQPNRTAGPINRLLGYGTDSRIYNLVTGAVWFNAGSFGANITNVLFLEQVPIFFVPYNPRSWRASTVYAQYDFVLKYDPTNGSLYVWYVSNVGGGTSTSTEPEWIGTTITDNTVTWTKRGVLGSNTFQENALLVQIPGVGLFMCIEWQYDPNNVGETPKIAAQFVGNPPPQIAPEIGIVQIDPNLNGYAPVSGRGYVYTFYNPGTLHETSPSPFAGPTKITETDNSNTVATIPGSLLPPLPTTVDTKGNNVQFQSYQIIYVAIQEAAAVQAAANGYSSIYLYGTKDGGATFFRVTNIFDLNNNLISNSDGSVAISDLIALQTANSWQDYFPLPTPQPLQNSLRLYEGGGPLNYVPDPENFGAAQWSAGNAGTMVVVPGDAPDGNAAIELPGTGGAGPLTTMRSNPFSVPAGQTMYFQAFNDPSQASAGTIQWQVISADLGTVYLTLSWTAGAGASSKNGTFVAPANKIRIRARATGVNSPVGTDVIWADPLLILNSLAPGPVVTNYVTPDESLTIPAPAALSQNPPPIGVSMALYNGSIFVVEQGTFKIWYSNKGDAQSFGSEQFLPLIDEAGVPVFELAKAFDRLIVGKQRNVIQVTGDAISGFNQNEIDPNHGVQSVRSSICIGDALISLLADGLVYLALGAYLSGISPDITDHVQVGFRREQPIGDPVKPLTDLIDPASLRTELLTAPCPTLDTNQNIYMFGYRNRGDSPTYSDKFLLATLTHRGASPWTTYSFLPPGVTSATLLQGDLIDPTTGNIVTLMAGDNGKVYQMWGGTQDGEVTATAVTWPLPDLTQLPADLRDTVKVFEELWIEGEDVGDWVVKVSKDFGATYQTVQNAGGNRYRLGINATQLVIKFTHSVSSSVTPLLSWMKLSWSVVREASGVGHF